MVYKIGVISTHRTGKTRLVDAIIECLGIIGINVKKIEEAADTAYRKGLPIGPQTTFGSQTYIYATQMSSELEISESILPVNYEVMVCDRGLEDNLTYLERIIKKEFDPQKAERIIKTFFDLTSIYLEHFPYQGLYLTPIIGSSLEDRERMNIQPETDPGFQEEIYQRLKKSLQEFDVEYVELPVPEEQDKFRDIWRVIVVEQTLLDLGRDEPYSKWSMMKEIREWKKHEETVRRINPPLYSKWEAMKKDRGWN